MQITTVMVVMFLIWCTITLLLRGPAQIPPAPTLQNIVFTDESAGWRNTRMWDLGRAAQSMVLAAWELGIGSAPATVFEHELAARLLGLPADRRCNYLLSFGYPADPSQLTAAKKRGGRKPLEALVHEERW